jgi:hypothetical protein
MKEKEIMSKKYDPLKGVNMLTKMLATESFGYGITGKIAGSMTLVCQV